jgi:hypothetical protein
LCSIWNDNPAVRPLQYVKVGSGLPID